MILSPKILLCLWSYKLGQQEKLYKNREFWGKLDKAKVPKDAIKVFFAILRPQWQERNYQKTVDKYLAHKFTNTNCTRITEWCQKNNLKIFSTPLRKQKTWKSPTQKIGEFQIDQVAISYRVQSEIYVIKWKMYPNKPGKLSKTDSIFF